MSTKAITEPPSRGLKTSGSPTRGQASEVFQRPFCSWITHLIWSRPEINGSNKPHPRFLYQPLPSPTVCWSQLLTKSIKSSHSYHLYTHLASSDPFMEIHNHFFCPPEGLICPPLVDRNCLTGWRMSPSCVGMISTVAAGCFFWPTSFRSLFTAAPIAPKLFQPRIEGAPKHQQYVEWLLKKELSAIKWQHLWKEWRGSSICHVHDWNGFSCCSSGFWLWKHSRLQHPFINQTGISITHTKSGLLWSVVPASSCHGDSSYRLSRSVVFRHWSCRNNWQTRKWRWDAICNCVVFTALSPSWTCCRQRPNCWDHPMR